VITMCGKTPLTLPPTKNRWLSTWRATLRRVRVSAWRRTASLAPPAHVATSSSPLFASLSRLNVSSFRREIWPANGDHALDAILSPVTSGSSAVNDRGHGIINYPMTLACCRLSGLIGRHATPDILLQRRLPPACHLASNVGMAGGRRAGAVAADAQRTPFRNRTNVTKATSARLAWFRAAWRRHHLAGRAGMQVTSAAPCAPPCEQDAAGVAACRPPSLSYHHLPPRYPPIPLPHCTPASLPPTLRAAALCGGHCLVVGCFPKWRLSWQRRALLFSLVREQAGVGRTAMTHQHCISSTSARLLLRNTRITYLLRVPERT